MDEPISFLSAQEIFDADDIEERVVIVPQWKRKSGEQGAVKIRTLTQKQSGAVRKRATDKRNGQIDNDLLEALLFVECVVEPKFTMADYGRLQDKSMAAISLILREILNASGMSAEAVVDATKSVAEESDAALRILSSNGTEEDAL